MILSSQDELDGAEKRLKSIFFGLLFRYPPLFSQNVNFSLCLNWTFFAFYLIVAWYEKSIFIFWPVWFVFVPKKSLMITDKIPNFFFVHWCQFLMGFKLTCLYYIWTWLIVKNTSIWSKKKIFFVCLLSIILIKELVCIIIGPKNHLWSLI